jgi:hypothetical protein
MRLSLEEVPGPLWGLLVEESYVAEASNPDFPDSKDSMLKKARRYLRYHRDMSPTDGGRAGGSRPHGASDAVQISGTLLDPPDLRARAEAVVPFLLKRCEMHWSVCDLRKRLGAPLSVEEARALIRAPSGAKTPLEVRGFWDGEEVIRVDVRREPLLRELLDIAEELSGPWLPMDMAWWILTGHPPRIEAMQAESNSDKAWPVLTLRVPLWVPAAEVGRYYTDVRRLPLVESRYNFSRNPSPRRLAVFRFVAEHSDFHVIPIPNRLRPRLPWRKLMLLWNEQLPDGHEWSYEDVRNFRRDFSRARDSLFDYD